MKHSEIYDKHSDRRSQKVKPKKKKGGNSEWEDRHARVSFKNYVRNIRQAELEEDLDDLEDDQTAI